MTERLGTDGHPMLLHRIRLERSLINGKPDLSRLVPCERCGAPVYLMDVEYFCGGRQRKVGEAVGSQYARHVCGVDPEWLDLPRCKACEAGLLEWLEDRLTEIERLRAEAMAHHVAARAHLERAKIILGSA